MKGYVDLVSSSLLRDYELPPPQADYRGAKRGFTDFCAGVGPQYPDIVAASRGMHKDEFDACQENGVFDIIEIKIGLGPIYAVTKKGNEVFDVDPRMMYAALAQQLPIDGEFADNPYKTWQEVSKTAPALPIRIILPETATGARTDFDALFLQGGCRRVPEIMVIYSAADRVPKCVTLRKDGAVTEVAEPYGAKIVEMIRQSPPGTIAVLASEVYVEYASYLDLLPVNGVLPSDETIENYSYEMATPDFFYFKRAHMRNNEGQGVVRGIREFMAELTSEPMMSHGGAFSKLGLVNLTEPQIEAERRKVRTLQRFSR
jgi:phosphate transport system substrate-binding protein